MQAGTAIGVIGPITGKSQTAAMMGNRNIMRQMRPSSANNKRKETPQGQNKQSIDFNPGIRQMMGNSGQNSKVMNQRSGGLSG